MRRCAQHDMSPGCLRISARVREKVDTVCSPRVREKVDTVCSPRVREKVDTVCSPRVRHIFTHIFFYRIAMR